MSKKNFTAVREGEYIKVLCDGKEVMDTCCEYLNVFFTHGAMKKSLNVGVEMTDDEVHEIMKVIRNVYDPRKKEIPPYKAPLFRNGEHVTHAKSGESYVVVGTPSDGYIIEETLEHAYCYKKLRPRNPAEMNRKWIRSQTKMEDGRFVSESYEQRGGPCDEILLPVCSPKLKVVRVKERPALDPLLKDTAISFELDWNRKMIFDGVLTSNEIDRAADKAIEMGYDGKDREIVFKAAHAVGLGSLIPSLLNEMGNAVPNVVSIQRAADRKLEERKTAQVSGVSAAATSSGDGGSIFGEVLEAVGDIAMGALDSVGDACSGIGECVGEVLSGIGDGL